MSKLLHFDIFLSMLSILYIGFYDNQICILYIKFNIVISTIKMTHVLEI